MPLWADTEAGSRKYYIKFGTVKPVPNSAKVFDRLLDACERYVHLQNAVRLVVGVNMGCHNGYGR
jgi:hypothetical protein